MKVNVLVRQPIMTMLVDVHFTALAQRSPQRTNTQADDHQRDSKLQPPAYSFWNRNS
jgi:hypothetical protein